MYQELKQIMLDRHRNNKPAGHDLCSVRQIEQLGGFVAENPSVLQMVQKPLAELGFARGDKQTSPEAKARTFLDELVEEMTLFAKVTRLSQEQLPWLNEGEEILIGLCPAKSPHTGMAVTYDQLTTIHPSLLANCGLSRHVVDKEQLYVSYSGDPQVKVFPLHLCTFVVLKRANNSHEVFDSLKVTTKLKTDQPDPILSDLSPIFGEVAKYNNYSKELLTTLFNSHLAPQIHEILEQCWQDGLLKRRPTLEELQLKKDELLSFIAYGHDSNNTNNLSRGPRSNPTDHWHNLIPQFRRRIIRLVKDSHPGDPLGLNETEQKNYAQVLERLNNLDPITAGLHLESRGSLPVWQQLKMADISGRQIAELLIPEGKIISDVQASLRVSFPDRDIQVSVANIRTDPDEVQMKHGAVIKIVAQGINGHELAARLLPLMSEYEAIKLKAFAHYITYISADNPLPLRKFLRERGLGSIVDQVLAWRPTVPMMSEAEREKYWEKSFRRQLTEEVIASVRSDHQTQPLINLIRSTNYGKRWSPVSKVAERKLKKQIKHAVEMMIVREKNQNNQFAHISFDNLVDQIYHKLTAQERSVRNGRWGEIRDLVEASIKGLDMRGSEANFSLPLGLVISVEEVYSQGELTSIVKISYSGNNSATVENVLGINIMRA